MGRSVFRMLLRLMPREFREEYGAEVLRVADERWCDERSRDRPLAATRFWARQSLALLRAAVGLHHRGYGTTGRTTMRELARDLRHALRALRRRPAFATVTILTFALGIGATTTIFSAVNSVLLRPLPYTDAERVAVLFQSDRVTGERGGGMSAANARDLRRASTLFDEVAVAEPWSLDLQVEGRSESLRTWSVSRGFFGAIGGDPLLGRAFTDEDYASGGTDVVVLGHGTWVERFGADPTILGRSVELDGRAFQVVGVLPPEFRFPDRAELWIPRPPQESDEQSRAADFMTGVARLRAGATLEQARADADRVALGLGEAYPRLNADLTFELVPLRDHLFGDVRGPLGVLTGAVAFLLLIACANVAGLMLARGAQRERDYALRGALGAGTVRLVAHVSAEALVLTVLGGALGVAIAYAGSWSIRTLGRAHLPRVEELSVDGTVLGFALLVSLLSAVLAALAPSVRLSRPDLGTALRGGARGSTGTAGETAARTRLVVAQVSAAVVLLVGAGLLIRSFAVLLEQDLGFDPENRLALQVFAYGYAPGERQAFLRDAVEGMRALPGVTEVALTTDLPSANDGVIAKMDITVPFTIDGRAAPPPGQEPQAVVAQVSSGYFRTMGMELVSGRDFEDGDNAEGAPVIVVNEALVRRHLGASEGVGAHLVIPYADRRPREIVGVVRDIRPLGHESEPRPEIYFPLSQFGSGSLTFVLQADRDVAPLTLPAMQSIWTARPSQSIWGVASLEDLVSGLLQERRFSLFLLSSFSTIALFLSAIGLYGLIAFSVERRIGELGVRRALGGRARDLVVMVVGEGTRVAVTGLVIGLGAAWVLSRFMRTMLFEVSPTDPLTFALLGALVIGITTLATLVPALRAMRVDPVRALRAD